MEIKSFDGQLFTWKDMSPIGLTDISYEDVTLLVDVGEFTVGSKFDSVLLAGSGSLLALRDQNGEEHYFSLKLSVGDKLNADELIKKAEAEAALAMGHACHDDGCTHH